jgi:hypothetical protein
MAKIPVDPVILCSAVRYALGRDTYMPRVVADNVRDNLDSLGSQLPVLIKDVSTWLARDVEHPCEDTWRNLLVALLAAEKDEPVGV